MANKKKRIFLIVPSTIIAKGLESIIDDIDDFEVAGMVKDFSRPTQTRLRNMDADVIIIDPIVLDYASRENGRNVVSAYTDASIVAIISSQASDEEARLYDETICLFEQPGAIARKLRNVMETRGEGREKDGEELSQREKEILVCVAKGMLNKEIADHFNISIYTVITHRKNITRKTGIKTVAGLTVYALLNNLIEVNSL